MAEFAREFNVANILPVLESRDNAAGTGIAGSSIDVDAPSEDEATPRPWGEQDERCAQPLSRLFPQVLDA